MSKRQYSSSRVAETVHEVTGRWVMATVTCIVQHTARSRPVKNALPVLLFWSLQESHSDGIFVSSGRTCHVC